MSNNPKKNPTILQVCLSLSWGGLEISTFKWARYLEQRGLNSITLCLKNSPLEGELKKLNLKYYSVSRPWYFSLPVILVLFKIHREHKIQAVCVHHLKDLWHTFWLKKFNPEIRVFGFARMFLYGVNKRDFLHRMIYNQLSKLWMLTSLQEPTLLKCLPIEKDRIDVLPNGVDLTRFTPQDKKSEKIIKLRNEFGAKQENFLVGLVARVSFQKGYREFVHAVQILSQQHPNLRFVTIGDAGDEEKQFLNEINQFVIKNNLLNVFMRFEHRPDIPDVMASLDLLVLPSYNEAFGNVLIEAMACKTAVLGTAIGGIPEVLGHGKFGQLIQSENVEALVTGITNVYLDSECTKNKIEMAYQNIRNNFAVEKIMEQGIRQLLGY